MLRLKLNHVSKRGHMGQLVTPCLLQLCRERAAQIEASEVAKDKDQDTIHIKSLRGRALSPDQEEASFRQFARDLTEKLGLSEAPLPDYLAKEVDTLKDAPVGVPGYPKKGGVSSGTSLLGNLPPMVPAPRKTHSLVTNVKASWWVENRNKQVNIWWWGQCTKVTG